MDDSISLKTDPKKFNADLNLFFTLENCALPTTLKHKNTVIKYTKLPDFDSKESWSHQNYPLHPRLRRIVTLEDEPIDSTRSLKHHLVTPANIMSNSYPKRKIKIIDIRDEEEVKNYTSLSKDVKKSTSTKPTNRLVKSDCVEEKSEKHKLQNTDSRIKRTKKYSEEVKQQFAKKRDLNKGNETIKANKSKQLDIKHTQITDNDKNRGHKDKDIQNKNKNIKSLSKINLSKNIIISVENENKSHPTKPLCNELKKGINPANNNNLKKIPNQKSNTQLASSYDIGNKKPSDVYIPYNEKIENRDEHNVIMIDQAVEINSTLTSKHVCVETDPPPDHKDQITQIDTNFDSLSMRMDDNITQTDVKDNFDSLHIPDVALRKERKASTTQELINYYNTPNHNISIPDVITIKSDKNINDSHVHKSSSYIIGRATVTYTREQKIDIHVVNDEEIQNKLSSALVYPLNVISLYKKEIKNTQSDDLLVKSKKRNKSRSQSKYTNDLKYNSRNTCNNNKVMKPSDIISTIRLDNSLLRRDFICKQFQRELNFIDSFFESLNYLEMLSEKYLTDVNYDWTCDKQLEVNESNYTNFKKIEDSLNVDDSETMASKSLCQLNLLIHNEQRRARDFLFVLKMQEDVLKDYIKSQMLWLEKKKKQDNIDISALKKKQRGALLKLQHECGEMQRMRKALLTLSEKRKIALIKTKKNIEMKLTNNVDVEQIILGKKKLKRNTSSDRCLTPLKCFDLSSSGGEDSTTSKEQSESAWCSTLIVDNPTDIAVKTVTSEEKSIQTGDSILIADLPAQLIPTTAENCVAVDGGYLNILFHNLSLPQIFSNGKQYEVNEEALKNIVNSSNSHNNLLRDTETFEKFMEQIKNHDTDVSSSASTAHSLVEEFDHYYKCLGDEEKSLTNSPECENHDCILKECETQSNSDPNSDICDHTSVTMITMDSDESLVKRLSNVYGIDSSCDCEPSMLSVEIETGSKEIVGMSVAGPLPVPAGAAAPVDAQPSDAQTWLPSNTSNDKESTTSDHVFSSNITATSQYASPVICEAEELRRQQLAIEREIKALEQQQCQLLVVREIPDKPPPPYTPPSEVRVPKPPKMFLPDNITEDKIQKNMEQRNELFDINDPFDAFFNDFCDESIERQRTEKSDKPWDACNLLPQKPQSDKQKVVAKTCTELKEVLSGATPSFVSGISSRRTDHIDDILFAEWRRCEPEWTSLHTEEASVKNQLFESIFNKLINETVEEYNKIVCTDSKENK